MKIFHRSLRLKLLIMMIGIGFFSFGSLLLYTIFLSETKILKQIVIKEEQKRDNVAQLIQHEVSSLQKEVDFLASLDVMEDILAEDIDKRIARVLMQKAKDLGVHLDFVVLDSGLNKIATSKEKISLQQVKNRLVFSTNIYSSFDKKRYIGKLLLYYDLENLKAYLSHEDATTVYLYNPYQKHKIGDGKFGWIDIEGDIGSKIDSDHIIVYRKLDAKLKDYFLIYVVDKKEALTFLYDFIIFISAISFLILPVIIYLSFRYSQSILQPIRRVTQLSAEIVEKKDYSKRLEITAEDEIAQLSIAFNKMLDTVSITLLELQEENKISNERYKQLQKTISESDAKSMFISTMSHELRTPLNSIIGSTQHMLTYESLSDEQLDSVGTIESSAHYLLGMINDILDMAKIESHTMKVDKKDIEVAKLLEDAYDMLYPLALDKDLEFKLIKPSQKIKHYTTDAKLFMQIVLNLVSNAIKFTTDGSVEISYYEKKSRLYVEIKDNGIGLDDESLQRLFQPFVQVDNIMQKKHKGTGLGLSLSKKMAHLLDGDIRLESKGRGFGTVALFWIK